MATQPPNNNNPPCRRGHCSHAEATAARGRQLRRVRVCVPLLRGPAHLRHLVHRLRAHTRPPQPASTPCANLQPPPLPAAAAAARCVSLAGSPGCKRSLPGCCHRPAAEVRWEWEGRREVDKPDPVHLTTKQLAPAAAAAAAAPAARDAARLGTRRKYLPERGLQRPTPHRLALLPLQLRARRVCLADPSPQAPLSSLLFSSSFMTCRPGYSSLSFLGRGTVGARQGRRARRSVSAAAAASA